MKTSHIIAIVLSIIVVSTVAGISLINRGNNNGKNTDKEEFGTITMFKSSSCGCCGGYSQYINKRGFSVNVIETPDNELANLKSKEEIPAQLCLGLF